MGKALLPSSLAEAVRIKSMGHSSLHLPRDEGFPGGTSGKKPACQCRRFKRHRLGPWVRNISWRRAQPPTPVSNLENPTDRGAWWAMVRRVAKSWTRTGVT